MKLLGIILLAVLTHTNAQTQNSLSEISVKDSIKNTRLNELINFIYPCGVGDKIGTCSLVDIKGETVMLTAKHVLGSNINQGDTIHLNIYKAESHIIQDYVVHLAPESKEIDLAMLRLVEKGEFKNPPSTLKYGNSTLGFGPGTEMLLFGYPQGIELNEYVFETDWGYPRPLQKTVKFAALVKKFGSLAIAFDGSASPGMSGGPVLYYDETLQEWTLVAIITSMIIDRSWSADGRISIGFSTGFSYGLIPYHFDKYFDVKIE